MAPHTLTPIPPAEEMPSMNARHTFAYLGIQSDTTGYGLIADGKFPLKVRRVGGRWMVNTAELRRYLDLDA